MNILKSACIHLLLVTLAIAGLTTVHQVERQRHVEHLVFAVPFVNHEQSRSVPPQRIASTRGLDQPRVDRLVSAIPASHEATPQPVKLDTSSPLELPQVIQRTVIAAPVARL